MNKIQILSKQFRYVFQIIFYLLPVLNAIYWVAITDSNINQLSFSSMPFDQVVLTPISRLLSCMLTAIPISLLMFIFYQLACIFKNYSHKIIFCLENAKRYKRVGIALFILAFANFLTDALLSIVLSYQSMPGERVISIGIGAAQIYPVIFGLAIYIISFIMEEAHRIEEDHKYTI